MAQNKITKVLSNRLEELTERKRDIDYRLSDKKQAEQMGIPYPTFVKYKGDKAECPISTIVKMAEYYGASTDYLLGRTPVKTTDPDLQAACKITGLSEKALHHLIFLNAVYDGFEILPPITMNKTVNLFLECENFEALLFSVHECAKKYINNNIEIAKLEQQLIDDPESEKLKELIYELQEKKAFVKWRASETFLGCMDAFLETNFDKKDGDPNG